MGSVPLSASTSDTQIRCCTAEDLSSEPSLDFNCYPSIKDVFAIRTIQIVALAIAVFLWGYCYKLSLYHHHPSPTSLNSMAKLWLSPRSDAAVKIGKLDAKAHLDLHSHVFTPAAAQSVQLDEPRSGFYSPYSFRSISIDIPVPARSPPSKSLI